MKLFSLLIFETIFLFLITACNQKTELVSKSNETIGIDTINIGYLGSYDVNPLDTSEKINQVYDKEKIKHGHWIAFGAAVTKTMNDKVVRTKIEEGYYRFNKKVGFWKFYNEDGTLKDSIEYKNDIAVVNQ